MVFLYIIGGIIVGAVGAVWYLAANIHKLFRGY